MNFFAFARFANISKTIAFILILVSEMSLAQSLKEFHVMERSSDGTTVVQASTEYPDNAMIIVYSAMRGLDFRSSVGAINKQSYNERANRYEILISPQRQILFVSSSGFIESRLALVNPKPKEVFYFEVEERRGQDEANVIFIVEPSDAKLFIDNIPLDINKTVSAPLGNVSLRLERPGYRSIEQNIIISKEQVNYQFKMDQVELQVVRFVSNVVGARIMIDDVEIAETDVSKGYSHFLNPGIYTVSLSKRMYLTSVQTIEVRESSNNADNTFTINLEKNVGELTINTDPVDAIVEINKQRYTTRTVELLPGKYQVEVRRDGFKPHTEVVDIKQDDKLTLNISLEQYVGSIMFSTTPSNANALLRNTSGKVIKRWEGLQILRDIPVGMYEIEVSLPGFQTSVRAFEVKRDERVEVSVTLTEARTAQKSETFKSSSTPSRSSTKPIRSGPFKGRNSWYDDTERYSLHLDFPVGYGTTTLLTYDFHHFMYNPNNDLTRYSSSDYGFQEQSKTSVVVPFNVSFEMEYRIFGIDNSKVFEDIFFSVEPFFSSYRNTFFDDLEPLTYPNLETGITPGGFPVDDVDTVFRFLFENALQVRRWGARLGLRIIPQVQLLFPVQYVGFRYQNRTPCINCQDNQIEAGKFNVGYGLKLGHRFENGIGLFGYWESWNSNFSEFIDPRGLAYNNALGTSATSASSRILGFEFQIPVYNNHLTIKYENPRIRSGSEGAFVGDVIAEPTNINSISMRYWQLRYTINFF